MLNTVIFKSIILDLMVKSRNKNKKMHRRLLDDFLYYLNKINNNELDFLGHDLDLEKCKPFLTELNLGFTFSIELKNKDFSDSLYELASIKMNFSAFIKSLEYDKMNNAFNITLVPQCEYYLDKLKNENLAGVDIFKKIKEVSSDLKITRNVFPREIYKWIIMTYKTKSDILSGRIYKNRSYILNPILNYKYFINIESDGKVYSFDSENFKFETNTNMNTVDIQPDNLFISRKEDIENYEAKGNLTEAETAKYNNLLKIDEFHSLISDLLDSVHKKNIVFKELICGKYQPIKNNDLDSKLDEINYFLSEFDTEISNFGELKETVENLLDTKVVDFSEVKQFVPLMEIIENDHFTKYLDEVS